MILFDASGVIDAFKLLRGDADKSPASDTLECDQAEAAAEFPGGSSDLD